MPAANVKDDPARQGGSVSIILPAKNEAPGLDCLLPVLQRLEGDFEVIVVDDGSTDATVAICRKHGVRTLSHPMTLGNGAAVKTGARNAAGETLVFLDADGQHDPNDIPRLLASLDDGYDMAVGARAVDSQASLARRFANLAYNRLASVMTGFKIEDLTSGFRAVRAAPFGRILYLLPNGFSYPTTSTMAFFRSGHPVVYVPIRARQRSGTSKISILRDGTRFFLIILKVGALFSPMRLFLPISAALFTLGGLYYLHTYVTSGRFTNMGALLFVSSLLTFLIGILSEQVSSLHYKDVEDQPHVQESAGHASTSSETDQKS